MGFLILAMLSILPLVNAAEVVVSLPTRPADLAVQWNATVLNIAEAEDGFLTLKGLRTAALAHIAMHDALMSIDGRYKAFAYVEHASDADPIAAATQAAYVAWHLDHLPGA